MTGGHPDNTIRLAESSSESIGMTKSVLKLLPVVICISTCVSINGGENDDAPPLSKLHPGIFEMVTCWSSDSEQPVATEINLDAVAKNQNQFDFSKVRKNGEWTECPGEDGVGFSRFRLLKSDDRHFEVEFQSNTGGTLTTASLIEFVIETRDFRKAGKPVAIQVLRIVSVETK